MPAKKKASSKKATSRKKTTRKKSPAKRAPKKPAEPSKPVLSEGVVARIVEQIVMEGRSDDEIRAKNKGDELIDAYIAEARIRLANASRVDRRAEIGAGVARMKAVYVSAIQSEQYSAAVAAERQIGKLLGLEAKEAETDAGSTPEQLDQLAQVEQHLRPLGLGPADYPVAGLARIAADRIRELEAGDGGG